jgi:hypothetical protein
MASVKDMNEWGFNIEGCRKIEEDRKLVINDCRPLRDDVCQAKDSYLKHIFVVEEERDLTEGPQSRYCEPNGKCPPAPPGVSEGSVGQG